MSEKEIFAGLSLLLNCKCRVRKGTDWWAYLNERIRGDRERVGEDYTDKISLICTYVILAGERL